MSIRPDQREFLPALAGGVADCCSSDCAWDHASEEELEVSSSRDTYGPPWGPPLPPIRPETLFFRHFPLIGLWHVPCNTLGWTILQGVNREIRQRVETASGRWSPDAARTGPCPGLFLLPGIGRVILGVGRVRARARLFEVRAGFRVLGHSSLRSLLRPLPGVRLLLGQLVGSILLPQHSASPLVSALFVLGIQLLLGFRVRLRLGTPL